MRGDDQQQDAVFSYVSLEQRVPSDHPLRAIRQMVDAALQELSVPFDELYANTGRPSIAPEKLLRALLLQALYGCIASATRARRSLVIWDTCWRKTITG